MNILTNIKTILHEWKCQVLRMCPIHECPLWNWGNGEYECIACQIQKFARKSWK